MNTFFTLSKSLSTLPTLRPSHLEVAQDLIVPLGDVGGNLVMVVKGSGPEVSDGTIWQQEGVLALKMSAHRMR